MQNPRSNLNNRVGYPRALAGCGRVALGTDGFASDMREEARVLEEVGPGEGEPAGVGAARLDAGWRLAEERLGSEALARVRDGIRAVLPGADGIEAEARAQAARLWRRW